MTTKISMDFPASYCIKISGRIDENWFAYYDNMVLEQENEGGKRPVTMLSGSVPDQAALISILTLLYDMRCPLLSVEYLSEE